MYKIKAIKIYYTKQNKEKEIYYRTIDKNRLLKNATTVTDCLLACKRLNLNQRLLKREKKENKLSESILESF